MVLKHCSGQIRVDLIISSGIKLSLRIFYEGNHLVDCISLINSTNYAANSPLKRSQIKLLQLSKLGGELKVE